MMLKMRSANGWCYLDGISRLSTVSTNDGQEGFRLFGSYGEVHIWAEQAFGKPDERAFDNEHWLVEFEIPTETEPGTVPKSPFQAVKCVTFDRNGSFEMALFSEGYLLNDQGRTVERLL